MYHRYWILNFQFYVVNLLFVLRLYLFESYFLYTPFFVYLLNDYQKYLKFGFSRATDIACNLIRRNLLSRDDAIELVKIHDGRYPSEYLGKSIVDILKYYNISKQEFDDSCDDFTNYDLFETSDCDLIYRHDGSPKLISQFSDFVETED